MNGDCIVEGFNGKFKVYCEIQDGTEYCGEYDTKRKAQEAWISAQKTLNNNNRTQSDVGVIHEGEYQRKLKLAKEIFQPVPGPEPIPGRECECSGEKSILVVLVGDADRPATDDDLEDARLALANAIEKNDAFVSHHAIQFQIIPIPEGTKVLVTRPCCGDCKCKAKKSKRSKRSYMTNEKRPGQKCKCKRSHSGTCEYYEERS